MRSTSPAVCRWTTAALLAAACSGLPVNAHAERRVLADPAAVVGGPPVAAVEAARPPADAQAAVARAVDWLVAHQNPDGGFGQGEESSHMGHAMDGVRDVSNVADTCAAALALLRTGSTPREGPHAAAIARAVGFVCDKVRSADDESLWVTDVRGTRLQGKIGTYVDTFLAGLLLAEVKGQMPDDAGNAAVEAALTKVTAKLQKHQNEQGGWGGDGWAAGLGEGLGAKALNRAAQVGVPVENWALARAEAGAVAAAPVSAPAAGEPARVSFFSDRDAGIELYSTATAVGKLADQSRTNAVLRPQVQQEIDADTQKQVELQSRVETLESAGAPAEERAAAREQLAEVSGRLDENELRFRGFDALDQQLDLANQAVAQKLGDERFVAGFGNNGGEEFLSYLQIGEALVKQGGEPFEQWKRQMTDNLAAVQNPDGSWTGHHCITGRNFCTAAAVMVLTVAPEQHEVAGMGR